jgi:hypothetical protein
MVSKRAVLIAGAAVAAGALARAAASVSVTQVAAAPPRPAPPAARPETSRRRRSPRKLVLAAALVAVLAVAGIAVAAWTITGSGTGYAKAASGTPLSLGDGTAFTTADLYPGATGSVILRVTNSNPFRVRITTVTGSGAITSNVPACTASTGVTFTNQTSLTHDVAASSTATVTLAGAVAMSNASDDSCQGAVFSIPVTLSGTSNP